MYFLDDPPKWLAVEGLTGGADVECRSFSVHGKFNKTGNWKYVCDSRQCFFHFQRGAFYADEEAYIEING